ncbi:RusA family crossover junction endodeoxyribonuclease [Actinomadura sp. KC216]|uniref:RusA family crossover junction endodeoxyribonuclease n=1 Tax=Actinomadura sp. KC216 TaxID=2530370 RepID=UPI00105342A0|nr:RusA family crossover junction endodeoxyribonuclease [Actinomadura sp. KC216]TDB83418.1 RusA family crossover junction endodeoxyribonuclease [Actinomadura sp. KC216]
MTTHEQLGLAAGGEAPAGPSAPYSITVLGKPAPQGSKRHVGGGRLIEQSKRVAPWREAVKEATIRRLEVRSLETYGGISQAGLLRIDGPVTLDITFVFDPPKSAPKRRRIWPITRSSGDVDKLQRSTFDALTDAGAFKDDSQVVDVHARKVHTNDPDAPLRVPGAVIRIREIS